MSAEEKDSDSSILAFKNLPAKVFKILEKRLPSKILKQSYKAMYL
jgi:hypothetical protein